jgi:outer membrane receptor protein involved in Fe transport
MVDGFDNDEVFTGAVAALFSQDAVREFQVLTASAPAEFGRSSAGTVNTVTKSGTNVLHGGAYYYLRDDGLNAKEHFEQYDVFGDPVDVPKAPFRQGQWGATLGGPLRRKSTFFFLSYERLSTDANNFVTIDPTVAASLERAGFPVELGAAPYAVRTDSALARLDHSLAMGHNLLLRGHYSKRRNQNVEPFGGIVARSNGAEQQREDWGVALGSTDLFGSGWLSEARVQLVRGDQTVVGLDPRCGDACVSVDQGGPNVTISGLAVVGRQLNTPQRRANLSLQASETVTRSLGRHSLRAGVDVDLVWRDATLAQDFGGRYVFTALPAPPGVVPEVAGPLTALQAFDLGLPAIYIQGYGNPTEDGVSRSVSLFAQDQWRVSSRLELTLGLRYQHYDLGLPTGRVSDLGGATYTYDVPARGDLAPRLSVSFNPDGRGRTLLRGALGVFHEDPLLAVATVAEVLDGGHVRLLQGGEALAAEAWRSPGYHLPEPSTPFPSLVQVTGAGFRAPRSRHVSLGWTQELGRDLSLSLDLVDIEGRHQIGIVDYNPLVPALGPGRRPNDVGGARGTSASVNQFANYGGSRYRGLALGLHARIGGRFEGNVSYTLSQAEDEGSDMFGQSNVAEDSGVGRDPADPGGLPQGFDAGAFRGPSAVDQRHRFVLSGIAQLPLALRLSGIVSAGSGRPFTALSGLDSNGNGVAANDRARRDPGNPATRVERNGERMASTASVDVRLARTFALPREARIELLVEAFNLFDRVNYSEVNNVFGPGAFPDRPLRDSAGRVTYGRYTRAYPPRQVQLAARLSF